MTTRATDKGATDLGRENSLASVKQRGDAMLAGPAKQEGSTSPRALSAMACSRRTLQMTRLASVNDRMKRKSFTNNQRCQRQILCLS